MGPGVAQLLLQLPQLLKRLLVDAWQSGQLLLQALALAGGLPQLFQFRGQARQRLGGAGALHQPLHQLLALLQALTLLVEGYQVLVALELSCL